MSNKLPRRNFIGRISLALSTALVAPVAGFTNPFKHMLQSNNPQKDAVKGIKPLGFQWETSDPFLFCVHHEDAFPKGNDAMGPAPEYFKGRHMGDDFIIKDGFRMYHGKTVPGFPGHPHRGFETVTVVRKGLVDHADSLGAAGRYGNGDVQWMTAGKGVQHSEMFPLLSKENDNPMELFQIWLNLPAKRKMVEPHFKMLWKESIPIEVSSDANGKRTSIEVIAGKAGQSVAPAPPPDSWAADPSNEVAILNISMEPEAVYSLAAASEGINRTLYFYEGNALTLEGKSIPAYSAVELHSGMSVELKAGSSEVSILMLQGKPIGEQVMQYGPFVMNTKEEIKQAFDDYNNTRFGGWPWPKYDQVHPRERGRFARHADGREEVKNG